MALQNLELSIRRSAASAYERCGRHDRREGIAKLVSEHREKLVFLSRGLCQLANVKGIVDGVGCAARELLRECQIRCPEAPARFRGHKRDPADHFPSHEERNDHSRDEAQAPNEAQ